MRYVVFAGVFLSYIFVANAFAIYFVDQERYIYIFDSAFYYVRFREFSALLATDPLAALLELTSSVRDANYNLLPVLFLAPFAWVFGASRLVYILAITNIYLLPFVFLIALFVKRLYSLCFYRDSLDVLAITALLALLFHPLWIPVLHGMVDVSGSVMIAVFLLLYAAKPFEEQAAARLLLMGLSLALMVLLRRWYAYWVVSFFVALTMVEVIYLSAGYGRRWKCYVRGLRNATIVGVTFLITLFSLATGFVVRALITDHSDIYASFDRTDSVLANISSMLSFFGPVVSFCAVFGLLWMLIRSETRHFGVLFSLHSLIGLWLFWRVQDFGVHHYYLLMPVVLVSISLAVCRAWFVLGNYWKKGTVVGLASAVLIAGAMSVFLPASAVVADKSYVVVPSFRFYPKIRTDLRTVDQLLDDLGAMMADKPGTVYVLGGSHVLSGAVLVNACRYGSRTRIFCDEILKTHEVDRRDGFPNQFVGARYVVLGVPTQYLGRPQDERVIGIIAQKIRNGSGIGASFRRLSREYSLDRGVDVWLYEKIKPFEKDDLVSLREEFIGHYPDRAYMFAIDQQGRDRDRYCWVRKKFPWLYEMIRTFRRQPKAACPDDKLRHGGAV